MSVESNITTVRRWVDEAWNHGDFSSAATMYTPTYFLHNPQQSFDSVEALKGFISMMRGAMPDLHMEIEDIFGNGEKVAWRFSVTGTHTGGLLLGVPATGKAVTNWGLLISQFKDGKWAVDECQWDALGTLQTLGVIPVMG